MLGEAKFRMPCSEASEEATCRCGRWHTRFPISARTSSIGCGASKGARLRPVPQGKLEANCGQSKEKSIEHG